MAAVLTATTMAQVASVMGAAVFAVIAPKLAPQLGLDPSFIGYQISILYGAAMVGSLVTGAVVQRWGGCRATQVGLLLTSTGLLLGLTATISGIVLASIALGLAMSILMPSAAHLLFRFTPPERRNLVFSLKQTGVPLAWALAGLLAPPIALLFGWHWVLVLVLALATVIIVLLQFVRSNWDADRNPQAKALQHPLAGLKVLWRHPVLRSLGMTSFFLSWIQLCVGGFAVTMLVKEDGYTLVEAGWLLSITQAAGVGGRILWGWVADRTGATFRVLQWLVVCIASCCLLLGAISAEWPVAAMLVLFVMIGGSVIAWNGLFLAQVARWSPSGDVSLATSGAMVWNFCGTLLGPAVFSTTYRFVGSYGANFMLLAMVAVAGFAAVTYGRRAARRLAAPARQDASRSP